MTIHILPSTRSFQSRRGETLNSRQIWFSPWSEQCRPKYLTKKKPKYSVTTTGMAAEAWKWGVSNHENKFIVQI